MGNEKYDPEDGFKMRDHEIGLTVLDFWKYAYSDLNADPRDVIAEFLVSNALGITESTNRQDWTLYDIDFNGIRVEVKCTGYYQTWRTDEKISEERRFSIKKATDRDTGVYKRHNDIYVFCLLNGKSRQEANPLILENWEFYVIPTTIINEKCGDNQSISLNKVRKLCSNKVEYDSLKDEVMKWSDFVREEQHNTEMRR